MDAARRVQQARAKMDLLATNMAREAFMTLGDQLLAGKSATEEELKALASLLRKEVGL